MAQAPPLVEYYQIFEIGLFVRVDTLNKIITELRHYTFKDSPGFMLSLHDYQYSVPEHAQYKSSFQRITAQEFNKQLSLFLEKAQERTKERI